MSTVTVCLVGAVRGTVGNTICSSNRSGAVRCPDGGGTIGSVCAGSCCAAVGHVVIGYTALGGGVWLAGDISRGWDVLRLSRIADSEDGRFPAFSLLRDLLILSGLAGDATRKLDLREEGIMKCRCRLDLCVRCALGDSLGLLLVLFHFGARGIQVAGIDVGRVCGVLDGGFLCALNLAMDLIGKSIAPRERIANLLLEDLLQYGADSAEKQWLEDREQSLVLGFLQFDVEGVDLHGHFVQFDEVLTVFLLGIGSCDFEAEAIAA